MAANRAISGEDGARKVAGQPLSSRPKRSTSASKIAKCRSAIALSRAPCVERVSPRGVVVERGGARAQHVVLQRRDAGVVDDLLRAQRRQRRAVFGTLHDRAYRRARVLGDVVERDVEPVQPPARGRRIRAGRFGVAAKRRVQRVDPDVRRAAPAEQPADRAQVGEVADPVVARAAQRVELHRDPPGAPLRRIRARRDDDDDHARAAVCGDLERETMRAQRLRPGQHDAPRIVRRLGAMVGADHLGVAQRQAPFDRCCRLRARATTPRFRASLSPAGSPRSPAVRPRAGPASARRSGAPRRRSELRSARRSRARACRSRPSASTYERATRSLIAGVRRTPPANARSSDRPLPPRRERRAARRPRSRCPARATR